MFCPNCGREAREQDTFCTRCGRELGTSELPPGGDIGDVGDELAVPWRGGQVALGIALVGIAFLLISGVTVILERLGVGLAWGAWLGSHAIGVVILVAVWLLGQYRGGMSPAGLLAALGLRRPRISGQTTLLAAAVGLRLPRNSWLTALLLTGLALGVSLGFTVLYAWLMQLLAADLLLPPDVPGEVIFDGLAAVWSFEALAGWTPLTEEIFFRGFVLAGLVHRWGAARAVVGSALIFAVFHLHPGVIVPIFVAGMLLAALYRATGSLWPPIIAHAAQNAIALVAIMYGG